MLKGRDRRSRPLFNGAAVCWLSKNRVKIVACNTC